MFDFNMKIEDYQDISIDTDSFRYISLQEKRR